MANLYELAIEHRALGEKLADTGLDEQTIKDTLDAESGDIQQKLINLAFVIKNLEAEAEAAKTEAGRMAARVKAKAGRANHLRAYALSCLQLSGLKKVDTTFFDISEHQNPESVSVDDQAAVPARFWVTPPKPEKTLDKKAILATLKSGKKVRGCRLTRTTRLSIR